jgi:hypothetical protein
MDYSIEAKTLNFLWSALKAPIRTSNTAKAERMFRNVIKKGFAFRTDIEDITGLLDPRLDSNDFRVMEFAKVLGINMESICFRPSAIANEVSLYEALTIENSCLFLILLEQMGFRVAPENFVKLLLPAIKSRKKKIFTWAETQLFWYEKFRHKKEAITFQVGEPRWAKSSESFITEAGYKVELAADEQNELRSLTISAPNYRKAAQLIHTHCPQCGQEWYKGDPESSANHRTQHKLILSYSEPKPIPELLEERKSNPDAELVTNSSPAWKQREIYLRARAFKREFRYDFIQWHDIKGDDDPDVHGFLFANEAGAVVGACAFRKQDNPEAKLWRLDWVWVCPKERRNGHLALRWPMFKERFGDFYIEHPVSDDMVAFAHKQGDAAFLDYKK